MKLIIIGNGFDLHHKLPTSYRSFREYLIDNGGSEFIEKIEEVFEGDLWSDFEGSLPEINLDYLYDFDLDLLPDDYEDEDHIDTNEIIVTAQKLTEHFMLWIKSLKTNCVPVLSKDLISNNNIYITFNYTRTLENVYGINADNILHIHGDADKDDIVVGHGVYTKEMTEFWGDYDPSGEGDYSYQEELGDKVINRYMILTYKDADLVMKRHEKFFEYIPKLDIDEIIILGVSMGDADLGYFKKIFSKVQRKFGIIVTYFGDQEKERLRNKLRSIGISDNQYVFKTMTTFDQE